jgi:hypothetical protein
LSETTNPHGRLAFALLLVGTTFVVFPTSASPQAQPSTQSLDGLWLADGYAELIEFQGDELHWFEITQLSCISAGKATRKSGAATEKEIVFVDQGDVVRVTPANSPDTRWLHEDGGVSSILLRRTGSRPEVCDRTLADTPMTNYQVFWETFAVHYPFFALRRMDWLAIHKRFWPQVTSTTKPGIRETTRGAGERVGRDFQGCGEMHGLSDRCAN